MTADPTMYVRKVVIRDNIDLTGTWPCVMPRTMTLDGLPVRLEVAGRLPPVGLGCHDGAVVVEAHVPYQAVQISPESGNCWLAGLPLLTPKDDWWADTGEGVLLRFFAAEVHVVHQGSPE